MAVERGAHAIRTHDVAETRDAALIGAEFARDRVRSSAGDVSVEELDVTTRREAERHLDRLGVPVDLAEETVVHSYELGGLSEAAIGSLRAATTGGLTTDSAATDGGGNDGPTAEGHRSRVPAAFAAGERAGETAVGS